MFHGLDIISFSYFPYYAKHSYMKFCISISSYTTLYSCCRKCVTISTFNTFYKKFFIINSSRILKLVKFHSQCLISMFNVMDCAHCISRKISMLYNCYVTQFSWCWKCSVGWQSSNLLPCNTLENHPSVIQIVKKHFLLDFRRQTLERALFMLKMKIKSHF